MQRSGDKIMVDSIGGGKMVQRLRLAGLVLLLFGMSGMASANPMVSEGYDGIQYPNTFHAQVTYFCMYYRTITGLTRNGKPLSLKWVEGTIYTDGGSGMTDYVSYQVCDCNLAPGTYDYHIQFSSPGDFGDDEKDVTVLIKDPPPGHPQSNAEPYDYGDEDVEPWNIPDSPGPRGLNCKLWCDGHAQADDDLNTGSDEDVAVPADIATDTGVNAAGDVKTVADNVISKDKATKGSDTTHNDTNNHPDKTAGSNCTSSNRPGDLPGMGALLLLLGLALYARKNKGQGR